MTDRSSCVGRLPQKGSRVVYRMNESQDTPKQPEQHRARCHNAACEEKEKRQSEADRYKGFMYTDDVLQGMLATKASAGHRAQPN